MSNQIFKFIHVYVRWASRRKITTMPLSWKLRDDVIKWKHFPRYWPFVRGIHRPPMNSMHKGQWSGALMFSLICAWTNSWANTGDAGDLGRHCTNYDVIVVWPFIFLWESKYHKDQQIIDVSLLLAWWSCWSNIRLTGDLRLFNPHAVTLYMLYDYASHHFDLILPLSVANLVLHVFWLALAKMSPKLLTLAP